MASMQVHPGMLHRVDRKDWVGGSRLAHAIMVELF